ncbi:hypothetical protein Drorol1_Dr00024569 [Drosera rotundifolia]
MGGHGERTRDTMTWPRENETALISILYERLKKGKLQCSTFTKDEWGKINEKLKTATSWDYGIERLKGKWNRLRIAHRLFSSLIEHTGVTWDPNTNEVHAAEEVWNHFFTKPKSSVSLLAMAVGLNQKLLVNEMVTKFLESGFPVMLFHYDGIVDEWKQYGWNDHVIHVSALNQTKWWFAKRFLHPNIVDAYDYVFLWDEDLGVEFPSN